MKSPAERRAEKERLEKIKRMKRTEGEKKYHHFRIPLYSYPHIRTDGDNEFLRKKAVSLITFIKENSPWQFYEHLKSAIEEAEGMQFVYKKIEKPKTVPTITPITVGDPVAVTAFRRESDVPAPSSTVVSSIPDENIEDGELDELIQQLSYDIR